MTPRVKHLFIVISTLELAAACSSEDPCDENPNLIQCTNEGDGSETDDTMEPGDEACVPLGPGLVGYTYGCQGTGNGWLELSIHPLGPQAPRVPRLGRRRQTPESHHR